MISVLWWRPVEQRLAMCRKQEKKKRVFGESDRSSPAF